MITAEALLDALLVAANAQTPEEKSRVAWRFSDTLWRKLGLGVDSTALPRAFNNLCQDRQDKDGWPWVDDLWTAEEVEDMEEERLALQAAIEKQGRLHVIR